MATIQVKIVDVSGQQLNPDASLNVPIKINSVHLLEDIPTAVANEVTIQTSAIADTTQEQQQSLTERPITNIQKHVEDANSIPCKDVSTPFDDLHGQIASGHASWWSLSKDWKSTHVFTGKNILFPVEMFIAVMEQKYAFTEDKSNLIADTLNRIPEPEQNSLEVLNMPATLWKHQNMSHLMKLDWEEFKNELLKQFGQSQIYSVKDRAFFLQSIQRGQRERMDTFLVRLNVIVNIVQQGQAHYQEINVDTWLKILLLAGIDDESRNLLPDDMDTLSSKEICKFLAKSNEKLYFEGQTISQSSTTEYDNFFTKHSALGWNDEDDIRIEDVDWLGDENIKDEKLTNTNEILKSDEYQEINLRQSKRLKLKRKSVGAKSIGGKGIKRCKTVVTQKTEQELEDSKRKALETNMFSCDKCGEIFDSVSMSISNNQMVLLNDFFILFK
jgi:hypothetical protein